MSPQVARQLVGEFAFAGSCELAYSLNALADGHAVDGDEYDETETELVQLVAEGRAPVELLQAFRLATRDGRAHAARERARLRGEIAEYGLHAVGEATQDDPILMDAFMDVEAEFAAPVIGSQFVAPIVILAARQRRSRSRRVRARSRPGSGGDDDPADLRPRCPRCGDVAHAPEGIS